MVISDADFTDIFYSKSLDSIGYINNKSASKNGRLPVIPLFLVSFSSLFPLFYVSFQIRPEAKGKLSVYEGAMGIYG